MDHSASGPLGTMSALERDALRVLAATHRQDKDAIRERLATDRGVELDPDTLRDTLDALAIEGFVRRDRVDGDLGYRISERGRRALQQYVNWVSRLEATSRDDDREVTANAGP